MLTKKFVCFIPINICVWHLISFATIVLLHSFLRGAMTQPLSDQALKLKHKFSNLGRSSDEGASNIDQSPAFFSTKIEEDVGVQGMLILNDSSTNIQCSVTLHHSFNICLLALQFYDLMCAKFAVKAMLKNEYSIDT